jgi:hypothetical protein
VPHTLYAAVISAGTIVTDGASYTADITLSNSYGTEPQYWGEEGGHVIITGMALQYRSSIQLLPRRTDRASTADSTVRKDSVLIFQNTQANVRKSSTVGVRKIY